MLYPSAYRIKSTLLYGFVILLSVYSISAASTISGNVFDKQRNALLDIDVELLNDFYQSRGRTRTDGSGRYQFAGLSDGRYTVRVYAFRYDLQDQEIPVEINTQNIRGGEGTGFFQQDFYLLPKRGGLAESELGVIFAQEIPEAARAKYSAADREFRAGRPAEGIKYLNDALKLFPSYYMALHRMGKELFAAGRYSEAFPILLRAAEVNPKSATTLYYLGYSLFKVGKEYEKAAYAAITSAHTLAPSSIQVLFVLGMVERRLGKYDDSEKHLLQAKKLSKTPIPEIHKELAQLYADNLNRYALAAEELEAYLKAARLEGTDAVATKKVIAGLREKGLKQPRAN